VKGDYYPDYLWSNSLSALFQHFFSWTKDFGGRASYFFGGLIREVPVYFFSIMGIPPSLIQIMLFTFLFLCSGFSMYYFTLKVFGGRTGALVASIFYMFNFSSIFRFFDFDGLWISAFLPLLLGIYVKILNNLKKGVGVSTNIILFGIVFTILCASIQNFLHLITTISALPIIFLYSCICESRIISKLVKVTFITLLVSFLLSAWWIFPYVEYLFESITATRATPFDPLAYKWTHMTLLELFRLNPSWGWYCEDFYPYNNIYLNPILLLSTFIPFIVAFSGLLLTKNKIKIYFACIITLLLFLAKGLREPLEFISFLVYTRVPLLNIFRSPSDILMSLLVIFFALLIGSSINEFTEGRIQQIHGRLNSSLKLSLKKCSILFLIIMFLLSAFPLLSGDVIPNQWLQSTHEYYSAYVEIPSYWYDAATYINQKEGDFRVLITPANTFYLVGYNWKFYGVDFVPLKLIEKPTIQIEFGPYFVDPAYNRLVKELYSDLYKYTTAINNNNTTEMDVIGTRLTMLAGSLNVRYILHRNDMSANYDTYSENFQDSRDYPPYIKLERSFGPLNIYRIETGDPQPWVKSTVKIQYKKVSPVKYYVYINASEPLTLTLSERYHPGWKAYFGEINEFESLWRERVSEDEHFMENGYANGWHINKVGNYTITLYFQPQILKYYGFIVSLITFLCSLSYITIFHQVRLKRKLKCAMVRDLQVLKDRDYRNVHS
jgi:hypothetical protein